MGYALALAASMLGIIAADEPTPINAKNGMNEPLNTFSIETPSQFTAIKKPSEKAAPKKIVLPACENPKNTPVNLASFTFYSIGFSNRLLNFSLICWIFFCPNPMTVL